MNKTSPVFNVRGVVLRATDVGERDRMLTILTAEYGKISVFARGVRKITSRSLSASQLFAYADYTLRRGSQYCFLNESTVVEMFHTISATIEGAALASYLCEVADELTVEDEPSAEMMQLVLNTLWMIAAGDRSLYIIKGAFEMRAAAIAGFQPDVIFCAGCESDAPEEISFLDVMNGRLICRECYDQLYRDRLEWAAAYLPKDAPLTDEYGQTILFRRLNPSALKAIRYVLYTHPKRQFSFSVDAEGIPLFADACETYLLHHVGHGYRTLSFYKSLEQL
ncbi:MAG: DNA repair protein RecO [Clostridia bacterium]|nr:DNA repair protein RecO [Clostridia bacterium]